MAVDFEIADLRSFGATVRAGSITRGALALGLSQPTVTQRIQRLEKAVGGADPHPAIPRSPG